MSTSTELQYDAHIMHTYARFPVTFVRGEGMYLWDADGKRYLDFLAGIAVNGVGHCHPKVVAAIQKQCATLMHTSNLFHTEPQEKLANELIATTNGDFEAMFFCNSGAEANEAAIKVARKHGKRDGQNRTKIITATNSFHGRTYGALSATAQPKYQAAFAPVVPDFVYVPFNDLEALQDAMDDTVCAVMLEPIQGEGGVYPADREYLKHARTLCDHFGAMLIFDEIQTGMGRTGEWWAYQYFKVTPDIITSAKALGGGLPIGACIARGDAATTLVPGDHGSTFAGNAVACASALAVIDVIRSENLVNNAAARGEYLHRRLMFELAGHITEVRCIGLMVGIELREPTAKKVVSEALKLGLVINATGDTTLRLLPPLIVTREQIEEAVGILEEAFKAVVG